MNHIQTPYGLIFWTFLVCNVLSLVLSSAVGLGVMSLFLIGPTLWRMGIHRHAIAALCVSSSAVSVVLLGSATAVSAQACDVPLLVYVLQLKLPAAACTILAMAATHAFWQRHLDRKMGWRCQARRMQDWPLQNHSAQGPNNVPRLYVLLPFLPLLLVLVLSEYKLDAATPDLAALIAMSVGVCSAMECIRYRARLQPIIAGWKAFLCGATDALSGAVALLLSAGIFAQGVKVSGVVPLFLSMIVPMDASPWLISCALVLFCVIITVAVGSSSAAFYPMVELLPKLAQDLTIDPVLLVLPVHQSMTLARPLSPVSAVVVTVSELLSVHPISVIARTFVPCLVGLVVHQIASYALIACLGLPYRALH